MTAAEHGYVSRYSRADYSRMTLETAGKAKRCPICEGRTPRGEVYLYTVVRIGKTVVRRHICRGCALSTAELNTAWNWLLTRGSS